MRALATFVCAAGMGVLAAGCAARTDGYGYVANGPYYDGYYDDYYGPVEEGFWGPDGYFYYGDHDHNFHRGEPAHFRREAARTAAKPRMAAAASVAESDCQPELSPEDCPRPCGTAPALSLIRAPPYSNGRTQAARTSATISGWRAMTRSRVSAAPLGLRVSLIQDVSGQTRRARTSKAIRLLASAAVSALSGEGCASPDSRRAREEAAHRR